MNIMTIMNISVLMFAGLSSGESVKKLEITSATVMPVFASPGTKGNTVFINWSATNETGNTRYEVERSFYSNEFITISTLEMPFNNGSISNYSVSDKDAELAGRRVACYRVKQTAFDGTITYSDIKAVKLEVNNLLKINLTRILRFPARSSGNGIIQVKDCTGRLVKEISTLITIGNNAIDMDDLSDLSQGVYLTETKVNGVVTDTQKIVIDK